MTKVKVGMLSWEEIDFTSKQKVDAKKEKKKSNFLTLNKTEPNTIRLISNAAEYLTHSNWKPEGDDIDPKKVQQWGYNVKCSSVEKGSKCPLCEKGHRAMRKWYLAVIDRSETPNTVKILDCKQSITRAIKPFTEQKAWGNPIRYDIIITAHPENDPQHYYSVTPQPPEPLSAEDLSLKDAFDMSILSKLIEVPTYDKVLEDMAKIIRWCSVEGKATTVATTTVAATPAVTSTPTTQTEAGEFQFTQVN